MGEMISAIQFDIIFIGFYNTAYCSARDHIIKNGMNGVGTKFSYDGWTTFFLR